MARKKHRGPISGLALHHELYTVLRQQIDEGILVAGSALPSEPHLAKQYAVSRTTVRRALERLAREKRVERKHGSGTYVRRPPGTGAATSAGPVPIRDLRAFGRMNPSKLITHKNVVTPPQLRAQHPSFGAHCLLVQRTRVFEGDPVMFISHHVSQEAAALLTARKIGNNPIPLLYEEAGLKPAFSEQVITCVAAEGVVAKSLGVQPGAPLLVSRRYVHEKGGGVLDFQECYYRPDRITLQVSVWREAVGPRDSIYFRAERRDPNR